MHARLSTFFFFNDTATTEIYTLSLHDALPISFSLLASPTPQQVAPEPSPLVPQPAASAPAGAMTVYVSDFDLDFVRRKPSPKPAPRISPPPRTRRDGRAHV